MRLVDYLHQNARLYPDKTAAICGGDKISYRELSAKVLERSSSYRSGQVVPFRSSQSIDFLITYFAIHQAGAVAAPLEKDIPENRFKEISDILSSSKVPEGTADILYTTGTTGKSKGVMISHKTIIADAENLIEGQGFSHNLLFIISGPLNHIGSLSKIFPVTMQGATLYILEGMKDLEKFFQALDCPAQKTATFFVPATIRMLLTFSGERLSKYADKIDFIESGAAPLAHSDMLRLCEVLPKTRLYNTYASTETGIISTYNFNDGECIPGCLGRPMSHSKIIITSEGKISCQGDTLMTGYVNDPDLTTSVLKNNTIHTSDIGEIDEIGRLHLKGRETDVINVGGFKVSPSEVEDAAMSFPGLKDCICIGVPHPITGMALKLIVELDGGMRLDKPSLARHLKGKLELFKVPMLYEQAESIKRTFNGKLDRKFYNSQNI
ncbi:MAG: acyl--CoA ligase [Bacteroidales bacterium]|nr:acyl--CoA ligase [Bacteroidales bacterium]